MVFCTLGVTGHLLSLADSEVQLQLFYHSSSPTLLMTVEPYCMSLRAPRSTTRSIDQEGYQVRVSYPQTRPRDQLTTPTGHYAYPQVTPQLNRSQRSPSPLAELISVMPAPHQYAAMLAAPRCARRQV